MQESISLEIKKLKVKLKSFLKNKEIVDIYIIGSSLKDKFEPKDIDIIVLFRDKNHEKNGEIIYSIKKYLHNDKIHLEYITVNEMFQKKIFSSLIHEGISIRENKSISKLMGYKSYSLFTFSLEKLSNVRKVRFSQTIYGRKNDGLIQKEKGKMLGKGAFIVPVEKEELFNEILKKFKVTFTNRRTFIKD